MPGNNRLFVLIALFLVGLLVLGLLAIGGVVIIGSINRSQQAARPTLTPTLPTVDTIMQCQAQRGILEFSFKDHDPGKYMFHAHQSEFAELGWMAMFDVKDT